MIPDFNDDVFVETKKSPEEKRRLELFHKAQAITKDIFPFVVGNRTDDELYLIKKYSLKSQIYTVYHILILDQENTTPAWKESMQEWLEILIERYIKGCGEDYTVQKLEEAENDC